MVDAVGAIPGRAHVPLHICIEGKHLAVAIECDIQRVAKAAGKQLEAFSLRISAQDVACREQYISIKHGIVEWTEDQRVIPVTLEW